MNDYVEFRQERDLGTIIADAFKFIRLEWRDYLKTILKMAIVPILIAVGAVIYIYKSFDLSTDFMGTSFLYGILIAVVAYIVAFVFINLAGLSYIKSYIYNEGEVIQEEVTQDTKDKFWSFLGFGILSYILIVIGFLFFIIPGFYVAITLMLGISILVFEDRGAFSSIGESFKMIGGHFWATFGTLIVVSILFAVLNLVFQIPASLYQMAKGFTDVSIGTKSSAVSELYSDPIYLILLGLSYIGSFLFYSVTLVVYALIYFDINEQEYATGALDTIDSLGEN